MKLNAKELKDGNIDFTQWMNDSFYVLLEPRMKIRNFGRKSYSEILPVLREVEQDPFSIADNCDGLLGGARTRSAVQKRSGQCGCGTFGGGIEALFR